MRQPNFFIIGGAKCGTTSLDYYLGQHPDVFMSPSKDRHHFATDLMPGGSVNTSTGVYPSFFQDAADETIVGESSVYHLPSKDAPANIRDYCPSARMLVIFRNPVDVIPSLHSQLYANGDQPIRGLSEALASQEARRRAGEPPRWKSGVKFIPFYYEMVDFAGQLERYLHVFGTRRIHTVLFDELQEDAASVVERIFDFLGVDPSFRPDYTIQNPNKIPRSPVLARLIKALNPIAHFAAGRIVPDAWLVAASKSIIRANTVYAPRQAISQETREELSAELRPGIDRLAGMLDRDLSHWYS